MGGPETTVAGEIPPPPSHTCTSRKEQKPTGKIPDGGNRNPRRKPQDGRGPFGHPGAAGKAFIAVLGRPSRRGGASWRYPSRYPGAVADGQGIEVGG